ALLAWYDRHRRVLPWRAAPGETPDPYRVWLSEIMLQQTTVTAVGPYYVRFLKKFPTVERLPAAPPRHVLRTPAGARLLPPRPQPARRRARPGGAARRKISRHGGGAAETSRDRPLHGGRGRGDRFRPARRRGRRQCRARDRAALRDRCAAARRQAAHPRHRRAPDAIAPPRRLRPGHDGSRRHHLHAEAAGVHPLPVERGVPPPAAPPPPHRSAPR